MLNRFFKYHLNHIAEGKELEAHCNIAGRDISVDGRNTSVVYSGGDDLFMIGNWLDITETAFDINESFRKYTGNPFITISGGIAINHHHFPVYQYARQAKDAEDAAKGMQSPKGNKNAITVTIFNDVSGDLVGSEQFRPLTWLDAKEVVERVNLFTKLLTRKNDCFSTNEARVPPRSSTVFFRSQGCSMKTASSCCPKQRISWPGLT